MKTPRFSGPFKWSALRQQLLSLREDIRSIQKVAGRNVTIDEHRGKGKVINARRAAAAAAATGACCIGGSCSITTEADCTVAGGTYQGDDTTCDPNPCCPVQVQVDLCFEWFPVGIPPDVDCRIFDSETITIPITVLPCPIDYETSGGKFGFTGSLPGMTNTGSDCSGIELGDCTFGTLTDAFWDAGAEEWTISTRIRLPGWPATFSYGPTVIPGRDLTAAGVITVIDQGCPSGGDPNRSASITMQFT